MPEDGKTKLDSLNFLKLRITRNNIKGVVLANPVAAAPQIRPSPKFYPAAASLTARFLFLM